MNKNNTIYKARKSVMGGGLIILAIVFFGITLPLLIQRTSVTSGQIEGLIGFWLLGLILTIIPLGFKIEVQEKSVKSYLWGYCIRELRSSDVVSITYGKSFPIDLGFGNGLIIHARANGRSVRFSMGESLYGKEAIEDVRRSLQSK
jgi:hypothetical protein